MTEPAAATGGRRSEREPEGQRSADGLWKEGDRAALVRLQRVIDAGAGSLITGEPPAGASFRVWPMECDYRHAVELVAQEPWNHGKSRDVLDQGLRSALAWVGLRQGDKLVATAHAAGDASTAWMQDVCVQSELRGQGYGRALVRLLLLHPAMRHADVCLSTSTAEGFYLGLGFVTVLSATRRAPAMMIRRRPLP